jgi:hypothetical protein
MPISSPDRMARARSCLFVLAALLLFAGPTMAEYCGTDDRVEFTDRWQRQELETRFSPELTDRIERSLYVLHTPGGFCTGTAISETFFITCAHCDLPAEGTTRQIYSPIDGEIEVEPVAGMLNWFGDALLYERKEGKFPAFLSPSFTVPDLAGPGIFALVGYPQDGPKRSDSRLRLFFSEVRSPISCSRFDLRNAKPRLYQGRWALPNWWNWFDVWRKRGRLGPSDLGRNGSIGYCADLFKGDSGSPLLLLTKDATGLWSARVIGISSEIVPWDVNEATVNGLASPLSYFATFLAAARPEVAAQLGLTGFPDIVDPRYTKFVDRNGYLFWGPVQDARP